MSATWCSHGANLGWWCVRGSLKMLDAPSYNFAGLYLRIGQTW